MGTKTYLNTTYLTTYISDRCDSCDSSDSSDRSDRIESSDSSDITDISDQTTFLTKKISPKNSFSPKNFSHQKTVITKKVKWWQNSKLKCEEKTQ